MLFGIYFSYNLPKLYFKKEICPLMKLQALDILKCIMLGFVQQEYFFKEVYFSEVFQRPRSYIPENKECCGTTESLDSGFCHCQ